MSHHEHPAPATVAGPGAGLEGPDGGSREVDPRAVRVSVVGPSRLEGDPSYSLAPPPDPATAIAGDEDLAADPLVDGAPTALRLEVLDEAHARLIEGTADVEKRTDVLFCTSGRDPQRRSRIREVVVEGWRFEVEVEPERRAVLRERARRSATVTGHGGPMEVLAIIPGRIVAVSVTPGDTVVAGQQVLVVEAMKMQNELRAPRDGTIERVGVAVGDTIEVGDLLVVIH
jgi:biotin carboxyl carrier protein